MSLVNIKQEKITLVEYLRMRRRVEQEGWQFKQQLEKLLERVQVRFKGLNVGVDVRWDELIKLAEEKERNEGVQQSSGDSNTSDVCKEG